ncbi:MAG: DUF1428 domain-containing protein [Celeribacter sp.]|jgi:uncharacterized protein YbaA (DUF1428 family)
MAYISGFVAAVPHDNKQGYVDFARKSWSAFQRYGAQRMVESWEDEVPDGKLTSFPMAVQRAEGEAIVFSWIEWPDKASCDACMAAMESDPVFADMSPDTMPFDGKRMIYGGFTTVLDSSAEG